MDTGRVLGWGRTFSSYILYLHTIHKIDKPVHKPWLPCQPTSWVRVDKGLKVRRYHTCSPWPYPHGPHRFKSRGLSPPATAYGLTKVKPEPQATGESCQNRSSSRRPLWATSSAQAWLGFSRLALAGFRPKAEPRKSLFVTVPCAQRAASETTWSLPSYPSSANTLVPLSLPFPSDRRHTIALPMSRSQIPSTSTSTSNFQPIFNAALKGYEKKTKQDLLAHPLAAQLQACNSPDDILVVLQNKVEEFNQSRSADERLSRWLGPTINILYAFSATLGGGVGLVGPVLSTCLRQRP
jgi:hypothetical protein